ncbi:MAG TPA: NUDIX domain-containing protein [Micromonosporaceae bacterium]|jgi:8-oxo-dGTP pyrophosphatase MutT (NUDIX family)
MARYTSFVDLHLILRDDRGRVLLGGRQNTGWGDGQLALPAGHLEQDESAVTGIVRETWEEVGVVLVPEALRLAHVMHHYTTAGRVALFFETTRWSGEITNREPDKCTGWSFVDPDDPPAEVVPYVARALALIATGERYSEGGWSAR